MSAPAQSETREAVLYGLARLFNEYAARVVKEPKTTKPPRRKSRGSSLARTRA